MAPGGGGGSDDDDGDGRKRAARGPARGAVTCILAAAVCRGPRRIDRRVDEGAPLREGRREIGLGSWH